MNIKAKNKSSIVLHHGIFKRTKFPQVNHEWKSDDDKPSSNNAFAGGEDINDDDLPF